MLGPETLADMKLSPLVVTTAVLGGIVDGIHVRDAGAARARVCTACNSCSLRSLAMHWLAGLSAGIVFLLGGWAAAMLTSQMGAPYVLFPVVLYALVEFLRRTQARSASSLRSRPTPRSFLTTFLPVVLLMMVFVHAVALVIDATQRPRGGSGTIDRVTRRDPARSPGDRARVSRWR